MTKKIVFVNLFIFLIFIFAIEGISYLLVSKDKTQALFNDENLHIRDRSFIQKNDTRGFSLIPNFENTHYTVNAQGFRGENFPYDLEKQFIILTLGESTTFGWGVHDDETYPYYLRQTLKNMSLRPYVINGGVPSYTSSQVLLYMQEIFAKNNIKPDLILINIMWNDIWYSSVKNWHPNILVHQKSPSWLNFLTTHSYFFYGLIMGFEKEEKETDIFNQEAYQYYISNLESMINLAKEHGSKIAFVEPPFDADHMPEAGLKEFQIHYSKTFLIENAKTYNKAMHKLAKRNNVKVLPHKLDLRDMHQKSLFLDPLHPTAKGNFLMAKDISQALTDLKP